jgi:hypothetical protein
MPFEDVKFGAAAAITPKVVERAVKENLTRGGNIFSNFLRETKDVVVGLPRGILHLGRSAINDAVGALQEVATLGGAETDFMLDDVGKAIASDYGYRYGPLFRGDFGEFAKRFEERPLSFALDALAGFGGAAKGASIASKAGGVTKALETIGATTGRTAVSEGVRLGTVGRALARAASHVDLAPETAVSVAKAAYRLLPKAERRLVGDEIVTRLTARNPLVRAVAEPFHRRFSEQPIEHFAQYVAEMEELVGQPAAPKFAASRALHLREVLNRAEVEGIRTYATPSATNRFFRKTADKLMATSFARHIRRRDRAGKEILDVHNRLADALVASAAERGVRLTREDALGFAHGEYQRLSGELTTHRPGDIDVSLGPEETAAGPIVQPTPDLDQLLSSATANQEALAASLAEDFGPKGVAGVRVKDRARAVENLGGQTAAALEDALGARVVVGSAAQTAEAIAKIRARYPIVQTRNYLRSARDDGYRAADVYAQLPDGTIAEIQVHTPLVASLAEELRPVSEALRSFRLKERVGNLTPEDARSAELTRHFSRGMWTVAEREAARDLAGHVPTAMDEAMESMRHIVWRESGKALVERLRMSPEQLVEHAYLPLRLAGGAEYDYALKAFVGGPDTLELARTFEKAGTTPPIYFPHIDTRSLPSWKEFVRSSALVGGRKRARPGFTRQSTGYLFLKDLYLKDPQQAYVRHAAEAARYEEALTFFDEVVSRHGREIERLDDFDPSVEALVAPDDVHRQFAGHLTLEDALHRAARADAGEDAGLRDALFSIADGLSEEQGALEVARWVGVGKGKLYAVPKSLARRIEEHVKPILPQRAENAVRLSWDSATKFWRGMVLSGSPRWLANNVFGNAMFLKMQGGKLRDATRILGARFYEGLSKKQSALLERMRELGIQEAADSGGFMTEASQYLPHMGSAEASKVGQLYRLMGQSKAVRVLSAPGRAIRFLNSVIEDSFREASYITALEKRAMRADIRRTSGRFLTAKRRLDRIAREGISDVAGREALEEMNFFLNDYHALPPFQRKVIRRFVSPFWSFYRHMGRLMIRYPIEYAERANLGRMLGQLGEELANEYGPVPSWVEGAGIPLGPPSESTPFLLTRSANPLSTIVTAFDAPASLLHPVPNLLWEWQTGRVGYSGREFTEKDVIAPFGSKFRYRIVRDENGVPIGTELVDKVRPDPIEMLLRQFPQYELAKDVLAGAGRYTAPGAFSLGVIEEGGKPKYPESRLLPLTRFAGIPIFPDIDVLGHRQRIAREGAQALREARRREGAAGGVAPSGGGFSDVKF